MSKTSFIDNEPAFRWSLVQDPMANEKLTEGESEGGPFGFSLGRPSSPFWCRCLVLTSFL